MEPDQATAASDPAAEVMHSARLTWPGRVCWRTLSRWGTRRVTQPSRRSFFPKEIW